MVSMPTVVDPDENIVGDEYTVYSPPDWIPKEEGSVNKKLCLAKMINKM
tara:strand:- start:624 stop:770 length:147 start_codon:yes stop_codon:yes gene_type:complete